MKLEDYRKYYIQGSDHYLIPKDEFVELLNEMINWKKETKELKKQLNYVRNGEYHKQLRFENEMLQQVFDTNGVPSEVYDYLECLHMNTELIKENNRLNEQLQQANDTLDTHNELIDNLNKKIDIMERYFELIIDLGFDYDGLSKSDDLKTLIDELVHYARLGKCCDTTKPIYENSTKKSNILGEEIIKSNEELKEQLEDKEDYTVIPNCDIKPLIYKYKTQQQEFIKYLEEKEKQFDRIGDSINSGACCGILQKYKEMVGVKDE